MLGSLLSNVLKSINYWYSRYLLMTELYMMERWERLAIHIFLLLIFLGQWVFNYQVLLPFTSKILGIQMLPKDGHSASGTPL